MGTMAELLANLHHKVYSPDGQLEAELRGDRVVNLAFRAGTYRHYTERTLETQLARLALRTWTAYQRGYDAALSEATGRVVERGRETWDAGRRRFRDAQAAMVSKGMSPGRLVYVETTGMTSWHFVIRDGALRTTEEPAFVAEVLGAYRAVSLDYRVKVGRLRTAHFGNGFRPTHAPTKEDRHE
ncbi:hypothetical protein LX16_4942 [Stackebrandtia albiflava]|uniref:Uncharacterized protein n=1 Tax=Stackebrandtia albiflava TaxID=406432 RepID=A0A562UQ88_9ACTN|nr:hypothetical protein [Stackebrandtia albiflava]TWJ07779.1 hypothetical protein LX16_4942 [Stackebrandtia albiflava]